MKLLYTIFSESFETEFNANNTFLFLHKCGFILLLNFYKSLLMTERSYCHHMMKARIIITLNVAYIIELAVQIPLLLCC